MAESLNFPLTGMDWGLFQQQRITLISLAEGDAGDVLSERQTEHLQGILNLTDAIVDHARANGADVPDLDAEAYFKEATEKGIIDV